MNPTITLGDLIPFLTERGHIEVELAAQKCINQRLMREIARHTEEAPDEGDLAG